MEVNLSVWLREDMVNHPTLKQLAKSLPHVLVQDRAPKTVSSYVRAYQAWKKWAVECSATALPADPGVFARIWCISSNREAQFHCLTRLFMEQAGSTRRVVTKS